MDRLDEASVGERVFGVLAPLHFGWFGGEIVKIAYVLLGLGVTLVTASGVSVWLARRRDKGRPAPAWERIWIACIWSQPAAYAASGLAALLSPPDGADLAILLAWLIPTLAALALAAIWPPQLISRNLRLASGGLLLAVPVAHTLRNLSQMGDPMAWTVNIFLLIVGLCLIASVLALPARRQERSLDPDHAG